MFKKFLPKQNNFFDLLKELTASVNESAKLLNEMLNKNTNYAEYSSKIHFIENRCDDITHQIVNDLNDTFITPIDREDIFALANSLDDIIDTIDTIAIRMSMYKMKSELQFAPQLADILVIQTGVLDDVIKNIQEPKQTTDKIVQVKTLETEGDIVFKDALLQLFEEEQDIKELIKKKEILEIIEKAIDRCQTAATVIEGILIKNM
ncbi:MAG: DUF47 family protein [Ignavibacteria bacterium]|nr:DUF47 family protein [Ignavibacteria bacterium]